MVRIPAGFNQVQRDCHRAREQAAKPLAAEATQAKVEIIAADQPVSPLAPSESNSLQEHSWVAWGFFEAPLPIVILFWVTLVTVVPFLVLVALDLFSADAEEGNPQLPSSV